MQESLLPLFPLELVLLPGNALTLHIFEDRYKEMIGDSIRDKTEFGIIQAGQKGILNIGCTAYVHQVLNEYPDGRMDILAVGRRRFEILFLDETKPYLRAAVNYFLDENAAPADREAQLLALACFQLQAKQEEADRPTPDLDDPELSFKVAEFIPELSFRQTLLSLRSESERLAQINQFFPQFLAALKRTAHVRKVAPKNGHGMIALGKRDE